MESSGIRSRRPSTTSGPAGLGTGRWRSERGRAVAEVYRTVGRDPIERTIARTREAQSGVKHHAIAVQTKAKIILASHRHDGHSTIELRRAGRLDWMVELNDDRGYGVEIGRASCRERK